MVTYTGISFHFIHAYYRIGCYMYGLHYFVFVALAFALMFILIIPWHERGKKSTHACSH